MKRPKFSVVIPTRNRPVTLSASLRACAALRYDDCEILVSDNHSTPETRAVVEAVVDPRVRYVRTDRPLPMHESWNFAIDQAAGEYLTIVGDDDALMPFALKVLDRVIDQTGAKVIRWPQGWYLWPTTRMGSVGYADLLSLPAQRPERKYHITCRDSSTIINRVLRTECSYNELPMVYNSAIHRSVLVDMSVRTGRPFMSLSPDLYSGFAVALIEKSYVTLNTPLGLVGQSVSSNGAESSSSIGGKSCALSAINEFYALSAESGVRYHAEVPVVPSLNAYMYETFMTIRDFYPEARRFYISRDRMLVNIYADLGLRLYTPERAAEILADLRVHAIPVLGMARTDRLESRCRTRQQALQPPVCGLTDRGLTVRASTLGINDVADAARLADHILASDPNQFIGVEFRPSLRARLLPYVPEVVRKRLRTTRRWLASR